MKLHRNVVLALSSVLLATTAAFAVRQEQEPQMPEPSPEHKILMERVGTWDAAMKIWMVPGAEPMQMTGVEKNRAIGSFHIVSEFTSDMGGMPFEGHGLSSWDPAKKKFISIWADNSEPSPAILEGSYDAKARALTFVGESMMMGQKVRLRELITVKDADHALFEMFVTGPDGKEAKSLEIAYTRKK